jgi:superfamily II DNA/RNA helicase
MSSRDQLKAKSINRMNKRNMRALKKKRKGPGEDDSDDESAIDSNFMARPIQVNAANQGKAETTRLQRKRQKILVGAPKSLKYTPATPAAPLVPLPPANFSSLKDFTKFHWGGEAGEDPPSEKLKTLRKEIGVLVKGNLLLCPPPVLTLHDEFLPSPFSKVFHSLGLSTPSPIQMQCWPAALAGANILALAPTGSGKTLAYGLPMIPHIEHQVKLIKAEINSDGLSSSAPKKKVSCPFGLILVPTRELASQVASALKVLKRLCSLRCLAIYGGLDKDLQIGELQNGGEVHVIVATPGRLLDLMSANQISLIRVTYLVIDEADRMLTLGFMEQLNAISAQIRPDRQSLLFTATFPGKLREAADNWCTDSVIIRCNTMELELKASKKIDNAEEAGEALKMVSYPDTAKHTESSNTTAKPVKEIKETDTADLTVNENTAQDVIVSEDKPAHSEFNTLSLTISPSVSQVVHVCASHKKPRLLIRFITTVREQEKLHKVRQPGAMIIFATKIKSVKFVVDFLQRQKILSEPLHGQLQQSQRERALSEFKAVSPDHFP